MELHFFQATVSLFFIVHIKNLDEFHCNNLFCGYILSFENVGELSLTYYSGETNDK